MRQDDISIADVHIRIEVHAETGKIEAKLTHMLAEVIRAALDMGKSPNLQVIKLLEESQIIRITIGV